MYKGKLPQMIDDVMFHNLSIDGENIYIPFDIFQSVSTVDGQN
jgi:hypothetical protein